MTLIRLQISIYCGSKGLYQYNYIPSLQQYPIESLRCEIPTIIKQNRYKFIVIFSLIPCILLGCCLYILCKHNSKNHDFDSEEGDSITDTISSIS